jgi:hypothetical protein
MVVERIRLVKVRDVAAMDPKRSRRDKDSSLLLGASGTALLLLVGLGEVAKVRDDVQEPLECTDGAKA